MIFDEAQTAAWNTWFEKGFQNHFRPYQESINRALNSIHKEIDESVTSTDLDKVAKDLKDLEIKVIETRANMRDDLNKVLASVPDIESMRKRLWEDLIFKFGCDLNVMLADVKSLIRKNIEDEVRLEVRKEITDEVREVVRKEIVEQLTKRRHRFSRKPPNVTDIGTKATEGTGDGAQNR